MPAFKFVPFMVIAALLLFCSYGYAAESVSAKNPEKILEIAKGFGSATLTEDPDGDPKIDGRINGTRYGIYFYGCSNNTACTSIQFSAGWTVDGDKPNLSSINEWNETKRFGKAYLDSDGDPHLEMDFPLPQVSVAYLEIWFGWWQSALTNFEEHIDF